MSRFVCNGDEARAPSRAGPAARTPSPGRWRLPAAGGVVLCLGALAFGLARDRAAPRPSDDPAGYPLAVRPASRPLLPLRQDQRDQVLGRISPLDREQNSVSLCLHLLRVHGTAGRFPHDRLPTGGAVLNLLTDAAAGADYFGSPAVARTRTGARFLAFDAYHPWRENHRDYVLAAFAELGLPRSHPLRLGGEPLAVGDVLRDSVANFHPNQDELTWTAQAYALYLPPARGWTNRYGEETTFDDLAGQLLTRRLDRASCAGTHLVYSLTVLARADAEVPLLTAPVRDRLWRRLREVVRLAVANQEPDGSWTADWHRGGAGEPSGAGFTPDARNESARLLVTGHLAEWLLYLPAELIPPDAVLARAGWWLFDRLRTATPEAVRREYCPYTHAACVVRQLSVVAPNPP